MLNCLKNQFVGKCSIGGVLANFCGKLPFWGPYEALNYFSHEPLNFSRRDASFKYPYDYSFNHNFLSKKVAILVETRKFCLQRVDYSNFHQGSDSHFYWVDNERVSIFGLFWGALNEKKIVTPLLDRN